MRLDDAIAVYQALAEHSGYYPTLERTHLKSFRVTMSFGHVEPDAVVELQGIVEKAAAGAHISFYADAHELGNHEDIDDKASAPVAGVMSIR